MKLLSILILLIATVFGISAVGADVYTWVDKNGVRHYSDSPPEDVDDARAVFPEYQFDESADNKRNQEEKQQVNTLIKEIEAEDAREKAEAQKKAEEAERNREPTKEERIAAEKERLEKRIEFLEEQPLEYFGSQRNKIVRIGYYHYQIQALMENPDKYFSQPASFQGNVKVPDTKSQNNASGGAGH